MTPERLAEIWKLVSIPETEFRPLFPSSTVTELLIAIDSLTAEIVRLRAKLEQAKHDLGMQNQAINYITQDWRREFGMVHEYLQKYKIGLGGEKIIELLVADAESLRTHLKAVVEAKEMSK